MKAKPARTKEFQSKLAAYSTTATVALLAAPTMADAQGTIYNITSITPVTTLSFPFSNAKVQSFIAGPLHGTIEGNNRATINYHTGNRQGTALLFADNGNWITSANVIERFGAGALIKGSGRGVVLADRSTRNGNTGGAFLPPAHGGAVTGYVGFKQRLNAHTYYGWLRVSVSADANGYPDEISFLAKNGDPGIYGAYSLASSDITAGEIAAVPEPSIAALGGLGLLALGARGVREMRRRRNLHNVNSNFQP
jgi:hypothetical protein